MEMLHQAIFKIFVMYYLLSTKMFSITNKKINLTEVCLRCDIAICIYLSDSFTKPNI